MVVLGDTLYVSDITVVRMFDREGRRQGREVAIKGPFNDIVAGKDASTCPTPAGPGLPAAPTPSTRSPARR
jgi:hypothetical protein